VRRAPWSPDDDFHFRAPFHQEEGGKEAYFAGAEKKAHFIREFRILQQWEEGSDVSTIYELDLGTGDSHAQIMMSEWHKVREGRIASSLMIFDTNAEAVDVMRKALGSHS
jgi:hypothetical protein